MAIVGVFSVDAKQARQYGKIKAEADAAFKTYQAKLREMETVIRLLAPESVEYFASGTIVNDTLVLSSTYML